MGEHNPVILLAEDDPDDQELIRIAFSEVEGNYQLQVVNDGKEALEYLKAAAQLPCLIVLDYNMPELNGAQVIQRLSADNRYRSIPKVILSTSSNPLYIEESLNGGASAYKIKPHNFQQLIGIAREMIGLCHPAA